MLKLRGRKRFGFVVLLLVSVFFLLSIRLVSQKAFLQSQLWCGQLIKKFVTHFESNTTVVLTTAKPGRKITPPFTYTVLVFSIVWMHTTDNICKTQVQYDLYIRWLHKHFIWNTQSTLSTCGQSEVESAHIEKTFPSLSPVATLKFPSSSWVNTNYLKNKNKKNQNSCPPLGSAHQRAVSRWPVCRG